MSHKAFALVAVIGSACHQHVPEAKQLPVGSGSAVARVKQPAEVIFGRADEQGRWLRLREVRFEDGKSFGWRIRLPCRQPIEFVEVMKLPAAGDFNLGDQRETVVSDDLRTATTHDYAACIDGWIEHSWALSKEDPKGTWEITVTIPGFAPVVFKTQFVEWKT